MTAVPSALAQQTDAPGTLTLGPFGVRPRVSLLNMGVDSNVFNESVSPKRDVTFSFVPALDVQMRIRRATIQSTSTLAYSYFQRYAQERSANPSQSVRGEVPFNRLVVRGAVDLAFTRERPGLEIDLRARRRVQSLSASADVRAGARTTFRVAALRSSTAYRSGVVDRIDLATQLNRHVDEIHAGLRYAITSLTTAVVTTERIVDRFTLAPARDATGLRIMPGLEFSRFALISGTAHVGWRRYEPRAAAVPAYSGVVSRVNLASVIRSRLRLTFGVDRDVAYSYSPERPYYLQTAVSVSATHRLGTRWETSALATRQLLAYRQRGTTTSTGTPVDDSLRGNYYGIGIGYFLRPGWKASGDLRVSDRQAGPLVAGFESWQIGGSVVYGF